MASGILLGFSYGCVGPQWARPAWALCPRCLLTSRGAQGGGERGARPAGDHQKRGGAGRQRRSTSRSTTWSWTAPSSAWSWTAPVAWTSTPSRRRAARVAPLLEEMDDLSGPYTLEVSSPGRRAPAPHPRALHRAPSASRSRSRPAARTAPWSGCTACSPPPTPNTITIRLERRRAGDRDRCDRPGPHRLRLVSCAEAGQRLQARPRQEGSGRMNIQAERSHAAMRVEISGVERP